jgi:hypothetical protein
MNHFNDWLEWASPVNTCGLYYQHITVIIYDRSDSGLYFKHVINHASSRVASALALARVANYVPRVTFQIVASLMIVIYNCNVFIVQATVSTFLRVYKMSVQEMSVYIKFHGTDFIA